MTFYDNIFMFLQLVDRGRNQRACGTYMNNDYINGGIELKTELTEDKESTKRRVKLVSQKHR